MRVKCKAGGPLVVTGLQEIVHLDGTTEDVSGFTRVLLCGCGHSSSRPRCDGSHHQHPPPEAAPAPATDVPPAHETD